MSLAICSLLLGAAVQILVARLCGSRVKGILATLACAPALLAVAGLLPAVQSGRAIDVTLAASGTPLTLAVHIDALSVLFALMG
ncbi:MAG TPA: NADH-quinone oxidoreductase subunit L, partial [Alphaproteobacteria bacterium]|nr:NADH-quinone oxidoreductase subunit L [Alphaproteobacteria bacterium]